MRAASARPSSHHRRRREGCRGRHAAPPHSISFATDRGKIHTLDVQIEITVGTIWFEPNHGSSSRCRIPVDFQGLDQILHSWNWQGR
jgi:hypothetical protein